GARFYNEAEKMLKNLETAVAELQDMATLRSGRVRVVAPTVISSGLLSKAFKEFKQMHPDIHFVLHDVAEEDIMSTVLSGSVDFGIGTANELEVGLEQTPLFDDHFIALCNLDHPLAQRSEIAWPELQRQPFIALAPRSPIRKLIDSAVSETGLSLNVV